MMGERWSVVRFVSVLMSVVVGLTFLSVSVLGTCSASLCGLGSRKRLAFEVAEAVFEFAVVVFDAPADLGQPHQIRPAASTRADCRLI
jgi:hypothetical protein